MVSIRVLYWCVCICAQLLSHVRLFATPWTIAYQAHLSMGFSKQEYLNGLPFPPPGDLRDPGLPSMCPAPPALAGGFFTTSATCEAHVPRIIQQEILVCD